MLADVTLSSTVQAWGNLLLVEMAPVTALR